MNDVERVQLLALAVLLAIVAVAGLAVLRLLFGAWRRFDRTQRVAQRRRMMPDLWQAAGDRLLAKLDQSNHAEPRPSPGGDPDEAPDSDAGADEDEPPDDDDDAPQSN